MSQRGRIDRDAGHAAPEAARSSRALEAHTDHQPRTNALSGDFISEPNEEEPTVASDHAAAVKPGRLSPGLQVLSDADAFVSEVAACETDRPMRRNDLGAFPLDVEFLSEDESVAGFNLSHAIDDPPEEMGTAVRHSGEDHAGPTMPPARLVGRRALPTAMTLTALSTSFFIAVVLVTNALDRMNEALFTTAEPSLADRAMTGSVVADAAPLPASPIVEPARFEPHAPALPLTSRQMRASCRRSRWRSQRSSMPAHQPFASTIDRSRSWRQCHRGLHVPIRKCYRSIRFRSSWRRCQRRPSCRAGGFG